MLETRKVFIDTQYFVKAGLHFDSPAFKSFREYCRTRELFHISTSVVEREVRSKIQASVEEALIAIKKFRSKARLLASLEDEQIKGLFIDIPEEEVYEKSYEVFDEFMLACSTEILEASAIDPEELLHMYFEKKPPFGEAKKKTEFPDAISLLSLKKDLGDDEKIYVISDDADLKTYCVDNPQFISVDTLDKLLDIYTTHTNDRHEQVKKYFVDNEESIKVQITKYLEGCEVWNSSTWEDAEVEGGLTVVNLGDIDPSVLYIDDEESQITFDIDVQFEVTVIGPDFINGIYDREDGRMYTFNKTSKTSYINATYTVEIFLRYEFLDGALVNAEDTDLYIPQASKGIEVFIEEYDEPDWY